MEQQEIKYQLSRIFKVGIYGYCGMFFLMSALYINKVFNHGDVAIYQGFVFQSIAAFMLIAFTSFYFYYYHLKSWSKLMLILQTILWSLIGVTTIEVYLTQFNVITIDSLIDRAPYFGVFAIIFAQLFLMFSSYRYDGYKLSTFKFCYALSVLMSQAAVVSLGVGFVFYNAVFSVLVVAIFVFLIGVILLHQAQPAERLIEPAKRSGIKMLTFKYAGFALVSPLYLYVYQRINLSYFLATSMYFVFYTVFAVTMRSVLIDDEKVQLQVRKKEDLTEIINEKKRAFESANQDLLIQSRTDVLTGLKNRNIFYRDISDLRENNTPFALMYIDLNRFKYVNDLHGHSTGDLLLRAVTSRLAEMTYNRADLYRIGGDEFAVTFLGTDLSEIIDLCEQIIAVFNRPFIIKNYEFNISASVGVSRLPHDTTSEKELLKFADIAMYQAKQYRKEKKYYIFSAELHSETNRKDYIARLLKSANINEEFTVFYQPLWHADDQTVAGCEALLRWFHPQEGLISPAEFIPIAEEIGIIEDLTLWVVRVVIEQLKKWQAYLPLEFKAGINLSPVVLNKIGFDQQLIDLLSSSDIDSSYIDIEMTENVDITTNSAMDKLFMSLFKANISVSIDDFGTGYSSLNYIKKFDIDTIKIAKELVDNIAVNEDERTLVKAIIMMSKGLHLQTVAEGVETKEQLDVLKDFGCDKIQGYYLGVPTNSKTFEKKYLRMLTEV